MKFRAVALGLAISIPIANAYTGDLTYYTPGMGSCGITNNDGDAIVALSIGIMQSGNGGNPNNNPICNKQISIHNPATGESAIATVTDTCMGCAFDNIDVTPSLFSTIAPSGNGRVHGIEWTPIGWTVPGGSGESDSTTAPSSASPVEQPSSSAAPAAVPSESPSSPPVVQPSSSAAPPAVPSESPSSPPPAAPQSSTPAAAPSVAPALDFVVPAAPSSSSIPAQPPSSSPAPPPSSTPTISAALCTIGGASVCSADGTQIGTCFMDLTVQMQPVAPGTKCEGGYMVMANSRLRSRRG